MKNSISSFSGFRSLTLALTLTLTLTLTRCSTKNLTVALTLTLTLTLTQTLTLTRYRALDEEVDQQLPRPPSLGRDPLGHANDPAPLPKCCLF